jgi:hypothetical protein
MVLQGGHGLVGSLKGSLDSTDQIIRLILGHLFGALTFGSNFKLFSPFDSHFGPQVDSHANAVVCARHKVEREQERRGVRG